MINGGTGAGFCLNDIYISLVLFSLSFMLFLCDQSLTLSTAVCSRLTFELEILSDIVMSSIYKHKRDPSMTYGILKSLNHKKKLYKELMKLNKNSTEFNKHKQKFNVYKNVLYEN